MTFSGLACGKMLSSVNRASSSLATLKNSTGICSLVQKRSYYIPYQEIDGDKQPRRMSELTMQTFDHMPMHDLLRIDPQVVRQGGYDHDLGPFQNTYRVCKLRYDYYTMKMNMVKKKCPDTYDIKGVMMVSSDYPDMQKYWYWSKYQYMGENTNGALFVSLCFISV